MATRYSNTLIPDCSVNANIRAWAQFFEDTLVTTGGWVVTSDAGQTLPSALIGTASASTKRGYRIYRMADSLQGSAPVFMRVDYGTSIAASSPGIWITIGTGSDGSGNITGILYNGGALGSPTCGAGAATTTALMNGYGSATPGRLSIAMFVGNTVSYVTVFCIERTKDATGADTSAGLLLIYGGTNAEGFSISALGRSRYLICAGGTQPLIENGLSWILTGQNPSQSFLPGDIGIGVVHHFKGIAQQPGTNVLVTNLSDVSVEGQVALTLYNQLRVYQQLNVLPALQARAGTASSDANSRVLMRYD